jgi:methionyl-tRNA formyltransferase
MKILGNSAPWSVQGTAIKHNIPIYNVTDPNSEEFHDLLSELKLDTVLNQTELLLKKDVLSIPSKGFVNRHASLLPYFRGRFASFWSHAAKEPTYGVTIHFVDEDIDTGDIILQQEFPEIDSCLPYPETMYSIQNRAPELFWRAMTLIEDESFSPTPNKAVDDARLFPTLADAYEYKAVMDRRRMKKRRRENRDKKAKEQS